MRTLLCLLLVLFSPIHATNYKHELAICVLIQDEAPYLKEWIEYHKQLGVSHFYIFNNLSRDNYLEVLKPYIEDGTAEVKDIPVQANDFKTYYDMQCKCFSDCVKDVQGICKWLSLIDIDEFLFPIQNVSLTQFLKSYEAYGGLVVNWRMFGTSGIKKLPADRLLIESLTQCAEKSFAYNRFVKSIVRPERVINFTSAHQANYSEGFFSVNTDKFPTKEDKSCYILWNKLVINHYWTRDEDFFYKVKVKRQLTWGGKPNPTELFTLMNTEKDEGMMRYVPALRKKIFGE